ncbi:MAG: DUF177 domain-containing protein [Burkholderiales bacterium]
MKSSFDPSRLDVVDFAREGVTLDTSDSMANFPRLAAEASAPTDGRLVRWSATGESRASAGRTAQPWLHLQAQAALPMTCQRCLEPVDVALAVDRRFRFVVGEDAAAAEDEDAEEDVLALTPAFNLGKLVEDELLMALPVVPTHEQCPVKVKLAVADPGFDASLEAAESPFAALERLRSPKKS